MLNNIGTNGHLPTPPITTDLHRMRRKVACVANASGAPGDGPGDEVPG